MDVKIAKFQLYPSGNPTGYAVGFSVTASNGRNFYTDTIVPLEETIEKEDIEIVDLAWDELKEEIEGRVSYLESQSPLLGSNWPPSQEEEYEEPLEEEQAPSEEEVLQEEEQTEGE